MLSRLFALLALSLVAAMASGSSQAVSLPATPMEFGLFQSRFNPDGTFSIEGQGWPRLAGTWKLEGDELLLVSPEVEVADCRGVGRFRVAILGNRVSFSVISDDCKPRRMILDGSTWRSVGEKDAVPERRIVRSGSDGRPRLPPPVPATGSWGSFRGPQGSGVSDGQQLPDRWNGTTGENILWRRPVPGLAHSSPVVWGDRIFLTTAVSSRGQATFKPGLYGDGDASDDRSRHTFVVLAIEARTGKTLWQRVAYDGRPIDKRHIKSTYASSTPATDGRIVVAWFGSHGVHAFDINGRPLWKVNLGRLNMGAYDIPTFEWGPASSPVLWNGLVLLQCDTQDDSFVMALDAETGRTVWKTGRDELPSWGTPLVASTPAGPELVTNASKFIRGYDPRTGTELWRLGGSSKITAPTPIFADGVFVIASGRAPERPIFVVRPGARGDITLGHGETANESVAWSKTGRGSYMPTPLAYKGVLYVLANNGVFDAYELKSGREIYRLRLPQVGSGYSASPVAADDRIYVSNEDGEMLVIEAGRPFTHIASNSMGELLMATPALSNGVMYVRTAGSLFAIGRRHR